MVVCGKEGQITAQFRPICSVYCHLLIFRTLQLTSTFVSEFAFQAERRKNNCTTINIEQIVKYRNFRKKNIRTNQFQRARLCSIIPESRVFYIHYEIEHIALQKYENDRNLLVFGKEPEQKSLRPKVTHVSLRQTRIRKNSKNFRNFIFFL